MLLTPGSAEPLCGDRLNRIGSGVRQVIAERSGHWVHLDEPELVLETIRSMVEQVSRTEVPTFHAGALRAVESDAELACANVVPIPVSSFSPSGTA